MNVYVVSNCHWREGSTVIGAAADRSRAERIADRYDHARSDVTGWSPWTEDIVPAEGSCTWRRDALDVDGGVHMSLFQEIVCMPLDGGPDGDVRNPQGVVADVDLSALPLHDPQWVAAELTRRGVRPFVAGTVLPNYGIADIQRWLSLAGEPSSALPTAAGVNRGRLIEMLSATTAPG